MLEDLDPCGLFEDFGFFPLVIVLCAGRVAYYQYTSAREDLAKRLKMVLSISECLVSFFLGDGTRSGTRSRDSCHWGGKQLKLSGRTLYGLWMLFSLGLAKQLSLSSTTALISGL